MADITPSLPKEAPQFTLKVPMDGPLGSKLFFRGQEVALVSYINVENTLETEDVMRSRLTIELAGELVQVEHVG